MTFRLNNFPKDDVVRHIVRIHGVESPPKRTNERRWRVLLRAISSKSESANSHPFECTIAPDYLWMLQLGSCWKNQRCISSVHLPKKTTFILSDNMPRFIWRDTEVSGTPVFLEPEVLSDDRTSKYPCYQLIWSEDSMGNAILLCISSLELVRFFIGMSPAFSRYIFGFSNTLDNYNLFRVRGEAFATGTPDGLEVLDGNLGALGRKLMISMLLDPIGKNQVLNFVQSCRAAITRNRNSPDDYRNVFPMFGLPFVAQCNLSVIGTHKTICIENMESLQLVPVFGVTRIISTDYSPPQVDMEIIRQKSSREGALSTTRPPKKKRDPGDDLPHDSPEPANTDSAILVEMGVDIAESYEGIKNVKLIDKPVERDSNLNVKPNSDTGDNEDLTGLSTLLGGEEDGGTTGLGRGSDDKDKPRKEKSLLLVNEDLEDLLKCKTKNILGPEDVTPVNYEDVPKRLEMVAALMLKTNSGLGPEWRKGFWNHGGVKEASLISLSKFPKKFSLLGNGKFRNAIVVIIENSEYRIVFMDMERRKGENIGIFSLLMPIDRMLSWEQISYILEFRLTPSTSTGTWPNAKTHGGGYVAKVQAHQSLFPVEDRYLGGKLYKFVNKLVSQSSFLETRMV